MKSVDHCESSLVGPHPQDDHRAHSIQVQGRDWQITVPVILLEVVDTGVG